MRTFVNTGSYSLAAIVQVGKVPVVVVGKAAYDDTPPASAVQQVVSRTGGTVYQTDN